MIDISESEVREARIRALKYFAVPGIIRGLDYDAYEIIENGREKGRDDFYIFNSKLPGIIFYKGKMPVFAIGSG